MFWAPHLYFAQGLRWSQEGSGPNPKITTENVHLSKLTRARHRRWVLCKRLSKPELTNDDLKIAVTCFQLSLQGC